MPLKNHTYAEILYKFSKKKRKDDNDDNERYNRDRKYVLAAEASTRLALSTTSQKM